MRTYAKIVTHPTKIAAPNQQFLGIGAFGELKAVMERGNFLLAVCKFR